MKGTILVVEDDEDIRSSLLDVLSDEGFAVAGAEDGDQALEYLRSGSTRPVLILLDLMMPRMDGREFREAQLADPELAGIPIVLVSADADVERERRALRAAGSLRKPIKLVELVEVISRYSAAA